VKEAVVQRQRAPGDYTGRGSRQGARTDGQPPDLEAIGRSISGFILKDKYYPLIFTNRFFIRAYL